MRFISIMTHNPTNRLPTEAEMASMHKLIVEGMKAGWLLECEGVTFGTTGVRVHKAAGGEVTVTDGPFAETKEVIGGYALLNAASKEEAVEHTRRFLEHVGQGTWETYQLFEMPTGEGSGFDDLVARSWQAANTEKQ
ncbi:MAG TPA: YciI family protein [Gemmataceae bacterium]|nr:YciI family protein [Gemmataceae bacterium]